MGKRGAGQYPEPSGDPLRQAIGEGETRNHGQVQPTIKVPTCPANDHITTSEIIPPSTRSSLLHGSAVIKNVRGEAPLLDDSRSLNDFYNKKSHEDRVQRSPVFGSVDRPSSSCSNSSLLIRSPRQEDDNIKINYFNLENIVSYPMKLAVLSIQLFISSRQQHILTYI